MLIFKRVIFVLISLYTEDAGCASTMAIPVKFGTWQIETGSW